MLAVACQGPSASPATLPTPAAAQAAAPSPGAVPTALDALQDGELMAWYTTIDRRHPTETFGQLLVRSARAQLGKPYFDAPSPAVAETLQCKLDSFQCVSLVESTLAVGRCIWQNQPTTPCFLQQLRGLRYRGGRLDGYPSRLHYFEEWLTDNAARGNLQLQTQALGGTAVSWSFFFMTSHPAKFPALVDPQVRAAIAATEAQLSVQPLWIIERQNIRGIQSKLHDGDVVAVTGSEPGILVLHTGLVCHDAAGAAKLLHASSAAGHVMLTEHDLAQYVLRAPSRRGIMVARPLAP